MKFFTIFLALIIMLSSCSPPASSSGTALDTTRPVGGSSAKPAPQSLAEADSGLPYVEGLSAGIIKSLELDGLTDYEKIRTIYYYLIQSTSFDDPVGLDIWRWLSNEKEPISFIENRALSPLLFNIGSCEDFAAANVMLLRSAGFEAEYVAGYTLSLDRDYVDHAWLVVKLGDKWYHLDPQLEQNVLKNNTITYRYFLKSDADMTADHRWGENLIDLWRDMPEEEKNIIRRDYTPPPCPESLPAPKSEALIKPKKPDMARVNAQIDEIRLQSGRGKLPPLPLNVEPPVLVAQRHITPPLATNYHSTYSTSFLSQKEIALYNELYSCLYSLTNGTGQAAPAATFKITPSLNFERAKAAAAAVLDDFPEFYWAELDFDQPTRTITLSSAYSTEEIHRQSAAIKKAAAEILAGLGADATEFEKALYIYDYVVRETYYSGNSSSENGGDIYGALIEKRAYCNGYARAFQYLAALAGFECVFLKGTGLSGVLHTWNAIKLGGEWYYVDTTWDSVMSDASIILHHDYFLISREMLLRNHIADLGQYPELPETTAGSPCYYEIMGYSLGGPSPRTQDLAEVLYKQLTEKNNLPQKDGPVFLEIRITGSPEEFYRWKEYLIANIFDVVRAVNSLAAQNGFEYTALTDESVHCNFNEATQVLILIPKFKNKRGTDYA